jgi:hypothetical protein
MHHGVCLFSHYEGPPYWSSVHLIFRLRDAATEKEAELSDRVKELERDCFELGDIKGKSNPLTVEYVCLYTDFLSL